MRQQVAVQLLYFAHYLRSKALPPSLFIDGAAGLLPVELALDLLYIHDRATAVLEVRDCVIY